MAIRLRRKTLVLILVIIVVVLGAGAAAYFFWPQITHQTKSAETTAPATEAPSQSSVVAVADSADKAIAENNPDQAKQIYADAANSATSDEDKGMIKLSEAKSFFGNGSLPPALDAGLQAETFLQKSDSLIDAVSTVGGIYEAMGDKPNAIAYYNKTIALIDSTKNTNYDRQFYVDSIAGLQKS
jgi:hypothetical protein